MRNIKVKKGCILVMCILLLAGTMKSNRSFVQASNYLIDGSDTSINPEPTMDAILVISQLISAENKQDWGKYVSLWCNQEAEVYESLFKDVDFYKNREGILNVDSAKVMYCEKVTNPDEIILDDYSDYEGVEAYLVGIDYTLDHVTEHFYNGINYRYIYVGKEDDEYKILGCTETSLNELKLLSESKTEGTLIYENQQHSEDNAEAALTIRLDRIEKEYVGDGTNQIAKQINLNEKEVKLVNCYNDNLKKTILLDTVLFYKKMANHSYVQSLGYSNNHTAKTSCNCQNRSSIKVYRTSSKKIETVTMGKYLKIVLNSEMVVSTTKNAALKAVMVCAHEYAYWNEVYYAKYPDAGYDVKDSAADQRYDTEKWSETLEVYKEKVRNIYSAVGEKHMHTKYGSVFETGYVLDSSYDQDTYGTLYQNGAKTKAENGKNYKEILHDYYDNTAQMGIENIGTVEFADFTDPL